jgi:hypothetical protein
MQRQDFRAWTETLIINELSSIYAADSDLSLQHTVSTNVEGLIPVKNPRSR